MVTPIGMVFVPPMPAPLVLAPLVPAPCTLPRAIVLPPISTIAIPTVVRTRRGGAQSGYEYDSGSEKKSRSAHGSLPYRVATCTKRNGTVAYSVSSKTFPGLSRWSRCEIGFRYDREADILPIEKCVSYGEQESDARLLRGDLFEVPLDVELSKNPLQIASPCGAAGLANPAGRL
jgi:hypothetical protein